MDETGTNFDKTPHDQSFISRVYVVKNSIFRASRNGFGKLDELVPNVGFYSKWYNMSKLDTFSRNQLVKLVRMIFQR